MSERWPISQQIKCAQDIIAGKEPHDGASIALMLEEAIERRGLQRDYMLELLDIVGVWLGNWQQSGVIVLWPFLRATPEQRARAFLRVTDG